MIDDITSQPGAAAVPQAKPIPHEFAYSFTESLSSGVTLNMVLGDVRTLADSIFPAMKGWVCKRQGVPGTGYKYSLHHNGLAISTEIAIEKRTATRTLLRMDKRSLGHFRDELTRAVNGRKSSVSWLVRPLIKEFGLVASGAGFEATKGDRDDLDFGRTPMTDKINSAAGKYRRIQTIKISELLDECAAAFEGRIVANRVEAALATAARDSNMVTSDGYRVMLNAHYSSGLCNSSIVRLIQENGFIVGAPVLTDDKREWFTVRWSKDGSDYDHLVAVIHVNGLSPSNTMIEIRVPSVDSLTSTAVKLIEDIRVTLGASVVEAGILKEPDIFGPSELEARQSAPEKRRTDNVSMQQSSTGKESEHFAFPYEDRRQIVRDYYAARARGDVGTMAAWVKTKHGIAAKTLRRYLDEFPDLSPKTDPTLKNVSK